VMLLREHPVGNQDHETINLDIITKLLSNDWGYWRTVTGNLKLLDEYLNRYDQLSQEDRDAVRERIHQLQSAIDKTPKSLRWKMRSNIGEKVKWYKDVEELMDR
jgi:hypothetical protein